MSVDPADQVRARRNLKWLFWLYTFALLVGTHYPRLTIGTPGDSPDKLLHLMAFGGWATLLWGSGYVRRPLLVTLTTAAFALLDELTQGIPGLGRTPDPGDIAADWTAAILLPAWIHALGPTGIAGEAVGRHEADRAAAFWRLLARPMNIAHMACGCVLGAMVIGVAAILIFGKIESVGPVTSGISGAGVGAGLGTVIVLWVGFRSMLRIITRESNHQECSIATWQPEGRLVARWVGGTLGVVILCWLGIVLLEPVVPGFSSILHRYERFGINLAMVVDIGVVGTLSAWVVRRVRVEHARRVVALST